MNIHYCTVVLACVITNTNVRTRNVPLYCMTGVAIWRHFNATKVSYNAMSYANSEKILIGKISKDFILVTTYYLPTVISLTFCPNLTYTHTNTVQSTCPNFVRCMISRVIVWAQIMLRKCCIIMIQSQKLTLLFEFAYFFSATFYVKPYCGLLYYRNIYYFICVRLYMCAYYVL